MTDRERLLEPLKEAKRQAEYYGLESRLWAVHGRGYGWQSFNKMGSEIETAAAHAGYAAKWAAHHALTAMALRDLIEAKVWILVENGHDGIEEIVAVYPDKGEAEAEINGRGWMDVEGPFYLGREARRD